MTLVDVFRAGGLAGRAGCRSALGSESFRLVRRRLVMRTLSHWRCRRVHRLLGFARCCDQRIWGMPVGMWNRRIDLGDAV